jgi:hypothetical protein
LQQGRLLFGGGSLARTIAALLLARHAPNVKCQSRHFHPSSSFNFVFGKNKKIN